MSLPTALSFRVNSDTEAEVIEVMKRQLEFWWQQSCALGQRLLKGEVLQWQCSVELQKSELSCFLWSFAAL